MYLLKSLSKDRIWGTPRLLPYGATSDHTGSVYSVAGISYLDCMIVDAATGIATSFFLATQQNPQKFGLIPGEVYPLIIDMLGADANLSIQVHPTDSYARDKGYLYGKSESWYFIQQPLDQHVYSGLSDTSMLNEITSYPSLTEQIAGCESVTTGDYLFVPAGTLHAITAGSLVYEIQQATDVTYRLYDYGRKGLDGKPRKLDVSDGLSTLNPEQTVQKQPFTINQSIQERAYQLRLIKLVHDLVVTNFSAIASALTLIKGTATADHHTLHLGQSLLLLPNESVNLEGNGELIQATPNPYWR